MSDALLPPKNVSPLIRTGRWAFFLGGIYYGYSHLKYLQQYDEPLRKGAIEKATKDHIQGLKDAEASNKESMRILAEAAGVKVKN